MPRTEIREGTDGFWFKPFGFDYSCIFVERPSICGGALLDAALPATVNLAPRERLSPAQARALGYALIHAAKTAEALQREFGQDASCKKPKQETYSSAGHTQRASPRRL